MHYLHKTVPVLFLIFSWSCATVGPDYVPPEKKLPEKFSTKLEAVKLEPPKIEDETAKEPPIPVKKVTQEMLGDWWQTLEDPTLSQIIERAIKGNLDPNLHSPALEKKEPEEELLKQVAFRL